MLWTPESPVREGFSLRLNRLTTISSRLRLFFLFNSTCSPVAMPTRCEGLPPMRRITWQSCPALKFPAFHMRPGTTCWPLLATLGTLPAHFCPSQIRWRRGGGWRRWRNKVGRQGGLGFRSLHGFSFLFYSGTALFAPALLFQLYPIPCPCCGEKGCIDNGGTLGCGADQRGPSNRRVCRFRGGCCKYGSAAGGLGARTLLCARSAGVAVGPRPLAQFEQRRLATPLPASRAAADDAGVRNVGFCAS